ncbi:ATP-binding protein [Streptomyces antibioticus]|uniref:hypothetical protein n=1 Tax=Streptomyces antibioticus TaxID=1890 RepID=UPI00224EBC30|nr:hypothetical protein [Streptomyces antibioticus]MCX4739517.1 hypothetical protein [Streptomyces antibioticus]
MSGEERDQAVSDVTPNDSQHPSDWAQLLAEFRAPADFWDRPSGDWGTSPTAGPAAHALGDDERRRDANSAYRLGTKALRREDLETARHWFEIASEQGHPGAAFRLTAVHLREHRQAGEKTSPLVINVMGGRKTAAIVAVEWLFRAVRWGHGDAAYLTSTADRLSRSGLSRVRAEDLFLAQTHLDDTGQQSATRANGPDPACDNAREDTEFFDEVREHIFWPLVAVQGRTDFAFSRLFALRRVAYAGTTSMSRPTFQEAMTATGTDAYAAIRRLVQHVSPRVDAREEDSDVYGVAFIGTPAAPTSDITAKTPAPDRLTGTARWHVVTHQSDWTVVGASTSVDGKRGDKDSESSARFTLQEDRVRELLMGEQLYGDRALAIRELYQNALDACRYRSARYEYLNRTSGFSYPWQGRIEFTQGVDEQRRPFLDCVDNGVGMSENELSTSFSRVGVRFPELPEFRQEEARWAACEPPVRMHANSRFGIGVLSYFMLADEIEVTTCRMSPQGAPGPVLKMTVGGPGELARTTQVRAQGRLPGTRVRLFLRDEAHALSCVDVLERFLGIAEYTTTARHGDRSASWQPHVLWPRKMAVRHDDAIDAHGWVAHTSGGRVVWCEGGGALLADGLLVQPSVRHGVFADSDSDSRNALHGAVVNLTGSPESLRLSVDRKRVLGDVSEEVGSLVSTAARELVTTQRHLVTDRWLESLYRYGPGLAEIVAQVALDR